MKTLGKTIVVHRGETFRLVRKVFKDDGVTPYVLAKSIVNPYLIITVSSNTLKVNGKYKFNSWLNLATYPSFRRTTPDLIDQSNITSNTLPEGASQDGADCIYYTQDSSGNKTFYYWNSDTSTFKEYAFVFHKQFLNVHTKDWIESQYQYEFRIVGGLLTNDYLLDTYKAVYPDRMWVPKDPRTQYEEIAKCRPELLIGVRWSTPLCNFFTEDILQKPQKLIVKPNI